MNEVSPNSIFKRNHGPSGAEIFFRRHGSLQAGTAVPRVRHIIKPATVRLNALHAPGLCLGAWGSVKDACTSTENPLPGQRSDTDIAPSMSTKPTPSKDVAPSTSRQPKSRIAATTRRRKSHITTAARSATHTLYGTERLARSWV